MESPLKTYLNTKKVVFEVIGPPTDHFLNRLFNSCLMGLILLNIVAVIIETVPDIQKAYHLHFAVFEWVSVVVFTLEYIMRLFRLMRLLKMARYSSAIRTLVFVLREKRPELFIAGTLGAFLFVD